MKLREHNSGNNLCTISHSWAHTRFVCGSWLPCRQFSSNSGTNYYIALIHAGGSLSVNVVLILFTTYDRSLTFHICAPGSLQGQQQLPKNTETSASQSTTDNGAYNPGTSPACGMAGPATSEHGGGHERDVEWLSTFKTWQVCPGRRLGLLTPGGSKSCV
jgi:hypothetical protein